MPSRGRPQEGTHRLRESNSETPDSAYPGFMTAETPEPRASWLPTCSSQPRSSRRTNYVWGRRFLSTGFPLWGCL